MPFPSIPPRLRSLFPHHYRHKRSHRRRLRLMLTIIITLVFLVTPLYLIYKPPTFLISYLAHKYPSVLWHIPSHLLPSSLSKTVALTIDDAPSECTEQLLDILNEYGAKATFFVIGSQVQGTEEVLKRILKEGHELGNHAWRDEKSAGLSDEELKEQVLRVEGIIEDAYTAAAADHVSSSTASASASFSATTSTGAITPHLKLFRPGSGLFHNRMLSLVHSLNYTLVLGSIYPHDPQIPYWRINAAHILSMLKPGGIIICHDRRPWTAPMLKRVLGKAVGERGWKFVGVGGLLEVRGARSSIEDGLRVEGIRP